MNTTRLVVIHAQSPLHAGTGQAVGAIDLPVARERATGIPLLHGSSIKGALRARSGNDPLTTVVFGPDTQHSSDHAGAVQFADAFLLFMPVRSVAGTFAWTTSPYLLRRLARDAAHAGLALGDLPPGPDTKEQCVVADGSALVNDLDPARKVSKVVLEDLDLVPSADAARSAKLAALAGRIAEWIDPAGEWGDFFTRRVCLVHDDVMSFLLDTSTEVVARIRLDDEKKTVARGALWYEESLPCESVLVGLAVGWDVPARNGQGTKRGNELLDHVAARASAGWMQLGGKSTTGRGVCTLRLCGGGA